MPSLALWPLVTAGVQFEFWLGWRAHEQLLDDLAQLGQSQQVFLRRLLRHFYFNWPAQERRRRLVRNLHLDQKIASYQHRWYGQGELARRIQDELAMIEQQHGKRVTYKAFFTIILVKNYGGVSWDKRQKLMTQDD